MIPTTEHRDDAGVGEAGGERSIPIEISVVTDGDEWPPVDDGTRVDVEVDGQMYPTARLSDGRYVAWWFETHSVVAGSSSAGASVSNHHAT